jgi:diaminopimelate epimerase
MTRVPFTKMDGTGNDFVILDGRDPALSKLRGRWPALSRALCDRRRGIGADGLLLLERSRRAQLRLRIFNPDGSEPSMCGNGLRCAALYASRDGAGRRTLTVQTNAGIKRARIGRGGRVQVDLGAPRLLRHLAATRLGGWVAAHADVIDSGVPHLVCWVEDVRAIDVDGLGRRLRRLRRFHPHGVNVDFVQPLLGWSAAAPAGARCVIAMRTYERGVEGETQACGTGAVASATSAVHAWLARQPATAGRIRPLLVEVRVPGGALHVTVSVRMAQGRPPVFGHAWLEGSVRTVARGQATINGSRP